MSAKKNGSGKVKRYDDGLTQAERRPINRAKHDRDQKAKEARRVAKKQQAEAGFDASTSFVDTASYVRGSEPMVERISKYGIREVVGGAVAGTLGVFALRELGRYIRRQQNIAARLARQKALARQEKQRRQIAARQGY